MKIHKYFILVLFFLIIQSSNVNSQNSYGWERIFNSIYGFQEFYNQQNPDNNKYWMVRPISNMINTGNYEFIKYNKTANSWYAASNSIFRGVYYSYYLGGGHSTSGYFLPLSYNVSYSDSNFILINTLIPHDQNPPYDIRLLISYDNGITKTDLTGFGIKKFSGIAINPFNDSVCLAVSTDTIYRSTDRGITWFGNSVIPNFSGSLSINPMDTNIIYAYDDSLFISSDGGNNFNFILNKKFNRIVFNFSDSSVFASSKNKLYRSSDHGFNWSIADTLSDSITYFETDPDNEDIVFAGSVKGLYRSINGGEDFTLFNNSFSPSRKVTGICKVANEDYVYVSTEEAVYKCWNSYVVGVENISTAIPGSFYLDQNYPNPFNPSTNLEFGISELGFVSLKVFDMLGKEVALLLNEKLNPGKYQFKFDGSSLPSGIYFYRLTAGKNIETRKMLLLK
ncbi:MAG TPA: T9SS type A sorting domain-containing protein [Ignavibacteria bacterium]|nr:T9SS type A sorting domain-containing protein [Ignavibacteria bacterium]